MTTTDFHTQGCTCGQPDGRRHEPWCGIPECSVCEALHQPWQPHAFLPEDIDA